MSAGQAGKGLMAARTLQVGADWVQVVEVVTAPEVLTHAGKSGWLHLRRCGQAPSVTSQRRPKWSGFPAPCLAGARYRPEARRDANHETGRHRSAALALHPGGVGLDSRPPRPDPASNAVNMASSTETTSAFPKASALAARASMARAAISDGAIEQSGEGFHRRAHVAEYGTRAKGGQRRSRGGLPAGCRR